MGGDAAREIHFTQCTLLNKEQRRPVAKYENEGKGM